MFLLDQVVTVCCCLCLQINMIHWYIHVTIQYRELSLRFFLLIVVPAAFITSLYCYVYHCIIISVLANICLVTHSTDLTILSHNSFSFFMRNNAFYKPPEKFRGFKSGEWGGQRMAPIPI
jgi:hypothetical protein